MPRVNRTVVLSLLIVSSSVFLLFQLYYYRKYVSKSGPHILSQTGHLTASDVQWLKCCGFTNYTDFVGSNFENENGGSLPPSCCWTNSTPCSRDEADRSAVQGCFKHILETLKEHANIVGGIAAGIGVLEIAAMIVSMYLYCHLDNRVS